MARKKESGKHFKEEKIHEHPKAGEKPHHTESPSHILHSAHMPHQPHEEKHGPEDHEHLKESPHGHLPLHEQIKRQLAGKKEKLHKPEKPHEGKKTEEKQKAAKTPAPLKVEIPAEKTKPAPAKKIEPEAAPLLTHFESSMMNRMEMEEHGGSVEIKITGKLGVEKSLTIEKSGIAKFLGATLPKKINCMEPGEGLEIGGMSSDELEELFKSSIPVEPKGEIEVSEREEGDRFSIMIKIAEQAEGPLFNYSSPGLEDVRRVVERQKLAMMSSQEQKPAAAEEKEDDWLQEQLAAQARDVAAIAKELGEKVKPPEPEPKIETAPEPKKEAPAPPAPAQEAAPQPAPAPSAGTEGGDSTDMAEFMDAYKEEAAAYVEALKKLPQLKDNPQNGDLIAEIHSSAHGLKSMSAAMSFLNISKLSKALEMMFAAYKQAGTVDMAKYEIAKEAVDRINALYSDLANSEKANVDDVVKKVEEATPA